MCSLKAMREDLYYTAAQQRRYEEEEEEVEGMVIKNVDYKVLLMRMMIDDNTMMTLKTIKMKVEVGTLLLQYSC